MLGNYLKTIINCWINLPISIFVYSLCHLLGNEKSVDFF